MATSEKEKTDIPSTNSGSFGLLLSSYDYEYLSNNIWYANNPSSSGVNILSQPIYVSLVGYVNHADGLLGSIGSNCYSWDSARREAQDLVYFMLVRHNLVYPFASEYLGRHGFSLRLSG